MALLETVFEGGARDSTQLRFGDVPVKLKQLVRTRTHEDGDHAVGRMAPTLSLLETGCVMSCPDLHWYGQLFTWGQKNRNRLGGAAVSLSVCE